MLSLSEVLNVRDSSHPSRSDTQSRTCAHSSSIVPPENRIVAGMLISRPRVKCTNKTNKNLSDDRDSSESSENE
jgi:hypothetical protein